MTPTGARVFGWLIVLAVVVFALVLILRQPGVGNSRESGTSPGPTNKGADPATKPAPPPKDPVAEAAHRYVVSHFLECGADGFYSTQNAWNRHYQFKNLQWSWSPLPLSEADNLNGIDWKGTLQIRCQAYRDTEFGNSWVDWESCAGSGITAFRSFKPDVGMTSRRGKWTYGVTQSLGSMAESGNSQVVDALAPGKRACSFYRALR